MHHEQWTCTKRTDSDSDYIKLKIILKFKLTLSFPIGNIVLQDKEKGKSQSSQNLNNVCYFKMYNLFELTLL